MTDIKSPKNPNDWIKEMIIFLISLFIVILFQNSIYAADSCPVSFVSLIQSEDSSSTYQLTYIYNGSEYVKTIKKWIGVDYSGKTKEDGFVLYNENKYFYYCWE